ncbi:MULTISPECIES: penicillin-binding protein activator [Enterobacter]|uniref:penicillin-binding protein activator n=1 Tax=Enterobacter TaxID=547 RepID=UPI0007AE2B70|nr:MULTISPECIES: penicillin-binding protein activator [Enterobacter]AMZ77789.1 hypothetical protein A4308_12590 [Enterobacter sp. ODB01]EKS6337623.1 penicillin-binding protein activator [Enterobacter hormaechei]VAL43319.1 protein YraM [Enterobacter kobei]
MQPSEFRGLNILYFIPLIAAIILFTGCAVHSVDRSTALLESPVQTDSEMALQRTEKSHGSSRTSWQLLTIRAFLREGKNQQASELFSRLPQNMDSAQHQEQLLLAVELKLAQGDVTGARALMMKISPADLHGDQSLRYWQCMVTARQGKTSPELIRALIAQAPLLTILKEKQNNINATWQALTNMLQTQVDSIHPAADENVLQGWLALRHTWSDSHDTPDRLKADITAWQRRWPQHPAAVMLPVTLINNMNFRPASVRKVALMLPLSGPGGRYGRAIMQGFEAGKKVAHPISDEASELMLYDTATKPVAQLLTQAQKDGATLVVGPLLKKHVEELLSITTTMNVLTLNLPEKPKRWDNVCYFALSPEDEARNAARHIRKQGKHFPLLLLPDNEISARVARAFAEEWRQLGGGVVPEQRFGSLAKLKAGVKNGIVLTSIPVTVSSSITESHGRGKTDAVYIIATPGEMGYIKPMIAARNGSQSGSMLYASSRSISGNVGLDNRLDLEGLQFSDIPLLANSNPGLKQSALSAVGNDYFLARLFAMGADAWMLANHYAKMHQMPDLTLKGNAGELSISSDCVIHRELPWFRYQQGQVVPVK